MSATPIASSGNIGIVTALSGHHMQVSGVLHSHIAIPLSGVMNSMGYIFQCIQRCAVMVIIGYYIFLFLSPIPIYFNER
jgi:hypothetical protein